MCYAWCHWWEETFKLGGETDTCVSEVTCPSHCECIVDGSSVIAAT